MNNTIRQCVVLINNPPAYALEHEFYKYELLAKHIARAYCRQGKSPINKNNAWQKLCHPTFNRRYNNRKTWNAVFAYNYRPCGLNEKVYCSHSTDCIFFTQSVLVGSKWWMMIGRVRKSTSI